MNKTQKLFRKQRSFIFSVKFAWKLKIFGNRGNFELKLSYWATIKSIMVIKFWNFDFKIWFYPILASLTLPTKTTQSSVVSGLSLPTLEVRCAKSQSIGHTKPQTELSALSKCQYDLRIPYLYESSIFLE